MASAILSALRSAAAVVLAGLGIVLAIGLTAVTSGMSELGHLAFVLVAGSLLLLLTNGAVGDATRRARHKRDGRPVKAEAAAIGSAVGENAVSSMSDSLSQLDAVGDVDPVAEADVYLAYGRDLQAEEILKEAMRSDPDRLAIRVKLLEVYAKRLDAKGFESMATQLYALTKGEGDDWTWAQELGRLIDPENALYQHGGAPTPDVEPGGKLGAPLGATTMPYTANPSFGPAPVQAADAELDTHVTLDSDFDLESSGESALDISDFMLPGDEPTVGGDDDPMARQLELADEFRRIGDVEGARDLLEEVIVKAEGALKRKALRMLRTFDD